MKLHKTNIDNEIYYYFLKNGEKRFMFRHKFYDALGKRKERKKSGFKSEKQAYRSLLEVKVDILNNGPFNADRDSMTVSQWLDVWYETYNKSWKKKTRSDISLVIKNHIKPLLGRHKLNELNYSTYQREFINKLKSEGYAVGSIRLYHKYFMMIINAAVRDDLISENRFRRVRIEGNERNESQNYLNPEELNIFLKYVKEFGNITQITLTYLLAYSGMRKGEAMALKWSDICYKKHEVTIKRTRDNFGTRSPKSHTSYRTIEIDPLVIDLLKKYEKWCIERKLSIGLQHNTKNDFIFIDDVTDPIHHLYINRFLDSLYNYMNKENVKLNRITPHGLRHTHASILVDSLVPPSDIAFRLGNTLEMILKVYSHRLKNQNNETVTVFSDQLKQSSK